MKLCIEKDSFNNCFIVFLLMWPFSLHNFNIQVSRLRTVSAEFYRDKTPISSYEVPFFLFITISTKIDDVI